MKKLLLSLFAVIVSSAAMAQTDYSVSTEVSKRNALLEEFTGMGCYWCRDGHAMAAKMLAKLGDKAYVVAIHTGHLAGKFNGIDLRTSTGDAIGKHFDSEGAGYPSGVINRRDFKGTGVYTLSRSQWTDYAETENAQNATVNLYQKVVYDGATRELSIRVEGYYTAEPTSEDQRLTVMITQDEIIGYQNGGGNDYEHNHVLRATLTDDFGDAISEAAKGNYFVREFSYTLPEDIGGVDVLPEDLEVICFVTDGQNDVQNVIGGKPQYVNYGQTLRGEMRAPLFDIGNKWGYNFFDINLRNRSAVEIENATFDVTVNGETTEQTVECEIGVFGAEEIRVPAVISYAEKGKTNFSIKLKAMNGIEVTPATYSGGFQKPKVAANVVNIQIKTDIRAEQNHFYLRDADGNLIREFGPYPNNLSEIYEEQITVDKGKTYCVEVTDSNGDGLMEGQKGWLILKDINGTLIDQFYTIDGYGTRSFFIVEDETGIKDIDNTNATNNDCLSTYDLQGRKVVGKMKPGHIYIKGGKKHIAK